MAVIFWIFLIAELVVHSQSIKITQSVLNDTVSRNYTINSQRQYILFYKNLRTMNPFRVRTYTPFATTAKPIMVVTQQEKQVTAWSLPLIVQSEYRKLEYNYTSVSKILCHDYMDSIVIENFSSLRLNGQNFIVSLSTADPNDVNVTIELEEQTEFYVRLNQSYNLSVSPSEPKYVFYKFDSNTSDTIVIEVDSGDDTCLTVSVQDSKCPVFDMNRDIKYEGQYQTINTKGAMTIERRKFVGYGGFFLVFVAKPDNYECSQESSYLPRLAKVVPLNQMVLSNISFKIKNGIQKKDYSFVLGITFAIVLGVGFLVLIAALICNRHGTISRNTYEDTTVPDFFVPRSNEEVLRIINNELTVKDFAKFPKRSKRRSYNYLWHTLSIAIFYSIPVVQLVVTYQRVVNRTGDEDMCYYNFQCANPLYGLSDFNHIFSNIGYVIFGIIFICVSTDRHRLIQMRIDRGIPVHYGLFHAMGVALIIEGILSACYHICPSQSNYQFDTSFMYVMAVLCMVKLYQNRHSDINATAYSTFTILGIAIFMATLGILNGNLAIWIIFVAAYSCLVIVLSFKIYFLNYVIEGLKQLKNTIKDKGVTLEAFAPIRKARFILILIANIANYSMLVTGLVLYTDNVTDFGTFLLGLLMGNAIIHTIFYTSMKIVNEEKICYEAICYGLLAIGTWAWSGVYFLDAATLWTVTPAESRQWNQECVIFRFFDKHDIWHILSAPALYFTFMYLMTLDDDVIDKDQNLIKVF